ncbi:hypothetical protein CRE_22125 [Caenorhabditis remanei]|uniref:Uncharacterized protein n=1 Tax=Caenorhabditis remanei TaxID=31234 RepID=E3NHK6_CAERE|nr:hypothetical protein CRE_22125 [Caenorhabditis remanei]
MTNARLRVVTNATDVNVYDLTKATGMFLREEAPSRKTEPVGFNNRRNFSKIDVSYAPAGLQVCNILF